MCVRVCFIFSSIVMLLLQGCVALQAFPGAIRSGDTITLALGSLEGANKNRLTVQFTSEVDSSVVDLTPFIRSVFNLHADKSSNLNIQRTNYNTGNFRSDVVTLGSAHSAWITVAAIDMPSGLTIGPGNITVQFDAAVTPVNMSTPIANISISLEILPNEIGDDGLPIQGGANPFEYVANSSDGSITNNGDLSLLEPVKQVLVRSPRRIPGNYAFGVNVGAAEFVFTVPLIRSNPNYPIIPSGGGVMVIRDINRFDYIESITYDGLIEETAAQTQMSWSKADDRVVVNFISPTGQLKDELIRFSLVPVAKVDFASTSMPVVLESVRYFDVNGTEISGVWPILEQINF